MEKERENEEVNMVDKKRKSVGVPASPIANHIEVTVRMSWNRSSHIEGN